MKIYEVSGAVGLNGSTQHHWHYAPTRRAARLYIESVKEYWDYVELEIHPVTIPTGRLGTIQALNDFIDQTCINEG